MKTLRVALAVLVLVVMLPAAGQSQQLGLDGKILEGADLDTLLTEFGRPATEAGVSFILVHLNDLTTDALFDVPLKYQLRAQARAATMFYVQGAADVDTELNTDFRVQQGAEHFQGRIIDIENFTDGKSLSAGDPIRGIVAIDRYFDPRQFAQNMQGIRVFYGGLRITFDFPPDVVAKLTAPPQ